MYNSMLEQKPSSKSRLILTFSLWEQTMTPNTFFGFWDNESIDVFIKAWHDKSIFARMKQESSMKTHNDLKRKSEWELQQRGQNVS